jgi:hypothetical protein
VRGATLVHLDVASPQVDTDLRVWHASLHGGPHVTEESQFQRQHTGTCAPKTPIQCYPSARNSALIFLTLDEGNLMSSDTLADCFSPAAQNTSEDRPLATKMATVFSGCTETKPPVRLSMATS